MMPSGVIGGLCLASEDQIDSYLSTLRSAVKTILGLSYVSEGLKNKSLTAQAGKWQFRAPDEQLRPENDTSWSTMGKRTRRCSKASSKFITARGSGNNKLDE